MQALTFLWINLALVILGCGVPNKSSEKDDKSQQNDRSTFVKSTQPKGNTGSVQEPVLSPQGAASVRKMTSEASPTLDTFAGQIPMQAVHALAMVKVSSADGLNLTSSGEKRLAAVNDTGKIDLEWAKNLGIKAENVFDLDQFGYLMPIRKQSSASIYLLWIELDGKVHAIENSSGIGKWQFTPGGKLWMLNSRKLWLLDLIAREFVQVTDDEQHIDTFVATASGDVFISGSIPATGASFSRRVRPDLTFEIIPKDLVKNQHWVQGDRVFFNSMMLSATADASFFEFMPQKLFSGWHGSEFMRDFVRGNLDRQLISRERLVVEDTWGDLRIFDSQDRFIPRLPFTTSVQAHPLDSRAGLMFDGTNVVKVRYREGKVQVLPHLSLKYPTSFKLRIVDLYGPDQGFEGWQGVLHDSARDEYYWGYADPETGIFARDRLTPIFNYSEKIPDINTNEPTRAGAYGGKIYYRRHSRTYEIVFSAAENQAYLERRRDLSEFRMIGSSLVTLERDRIQFVDGDEFVLQDLNYRFIDTVAFDPHAGKVLVVAGHGLYIYQDLNFQLEKYIELSFDDHFFTRRIQQPIMTAEGEIFVSFSDTDASDLFVVDQQHQVVSAHTLAEIEYPTLPMIGEEFSGAVEYARAWGAEKLLIAGRVRGEYQSNVYDLSTREEQRLGALDGIQVYNSIALPDNYLLVNGLQVETNRLVTIVVSPSGFTEHFDSKSQIQILKVVAGSVD